jgi:CHAT domain-containing protein
MGVPDDFAPNIRREVESIASVLPDAVVVVGEGATSDVLRRQGPSARVIHLGTHGVARDDNALFSAIRLADKYLTFYDFYRLQLPVQLITLSGCATGVSAIAAGDELQGLTRGLLSAGAASLVVTLWDVQDQTTAEFMTAFYENLLVHSSKSDAMRVTMLKFRQQYRHPFHWAPFTVVGSRAGLTK